MTGQAPIIEHFRTNVLPARDDYWALVDDALLFARRADQAAHAERIAEYIGLIRDLDAGHADFFNAFNYGWTLDSANYGMYISGHLIHEAETARHQVILLRALTTLDAFDRKHGARRDLGGIAARWLLSLDTSPFAVVNGTYRYVIIPYGFAIAVTRLGAALRQTVQGDVDNPHAPAANILQAMAVSGPTADVSRQFAATLLPPYLARAEARRRSIFRIDRIVALERAITAASPDFAGASRFLDHPPRGDFERSFEDIVANYALLHELGHLIERHAGAGNPMHEIVADGIAVELFVQTWGWWADSAANPGLSDELWPVYGTLVSAWALVVIVALEEAASATPNSDRLSSLLRREGVVRNRIEQLVNEVYPKFGVPVAPAEIETLRGVVRYLDSLRRSMISREGPPFADWLKAAQSVV